MTSIFQLISAPGAVKSSKKGGPSPSPPLQLGAARTPCPRPTARPRRSGPGPLPRRVTQAPRAGRSRGPAAQVGRGGRGASVTPAGERGGAAAAPRPGKKPARCGFGARRQRGGDSRPRQPTPPPARGPAPLRPRRAASRSSRSRPVPGALPPPACRARSGRAGRSREARPRDPSASPAQPRRGASPGSPSPSPSRPALASAPELSGAPSTRQHELQRRLAPAHQHAGPHDPRRVRPRPALRDDLRRGRRGRRRRRRRGHQQDVLLAALHGHRPELGRLRVGTGPGPPPSPGTLGPGGIPDRRGNSGPEMGRSVSPRSCAHSSLALGPDRRVPRAPR